MLLGGIWINASAYLSRGEPYVAAGVGKGPPLSRGPQVYLGSDVGHLSGELSPAWAVTEAVMAVRMEGFLCMPQRSGKLVIYRGLNIKTWRKSQGQFAFVFTTARVPLPSVCVTSVSDVYLYPMQSLPDGHVPGMRMDRGVSMPNMLEPKASADVIHFPSRQWRFDSEMQIKYGKCLSSSVFLYLSVLLMCQTSPFVLDFARPSCQCSGRLRAARLLGSKRIFQSQNKDTEDAQQQVLRQASTSQNSRANSMGKPQICQVGKVMQIIVAHNTLLRLSWFKN